MLEMNASINNSAEIIPSDVKFYSDIVPAFKYDGIIYVVVTNVLRNIGFNEDRVTAIKSKWRDDEVISQGSKKFNILTKGGVQNTYCITYKMLTLALAKISITPTLKNEYPDVVKNLERYQLECSDILYNYFNNGLTKNPAISDPNVPLTREELAMYFSYFINGAKTLIASIDKRLEFVERGYSDIKATLSSVSDSTVATNENISTFIKTVDSFVKSQEKFNKSISGFASSFEKMTAAKIESTPAIIKDTRLKNTLSKYEMEKWLNDIWTSARIISDRSGNKVGTSFLEIYSIMCNTVPDLWDINEEYKKVYPEKKMINMINESDYLRPIAEDAVKELHKKYYPEKYTIEKIADSKPIYKSRLLLSTPSDVRYLINKIAKRRNCSYNSAAAYAYKEIDMRKVIKIKSLAKEYAYSNGCSNCSKAYYIAQNKDLIDLLKKIAEE